MDRYDSPDYTRMSTPGIDEHKEDGGASYYSVPAEPQQSIEPEPSVSHVNFHAVEEEEDNPAARLSGRKDTLDSSSKEPSLQHLQRDSLTNANLAPATVIAFINFHSGGKTGEKLAAELIHELGRDHVFDLKGDKGPAKGLRLFKGTPNLRVVIGGGDGTMNWVLSQMRMEGMSDVPAGCIPLGTGNDTSRAFGWGFKYPGVKKIKQNIDRMRTCKPEAIMHYDRWHAFAQYEEPATDEWLQSLPASVRPIKSARDIPDFYRHPSSVHLPPAELAAKDHVQRPKPHRAATIDHDAREQGYNVEAVPLDKRNEHNADIPLEPVAKSSSAAAASSSSSSSSVALPAPPSSDNINGLAEQGPGRFFGSEWNNYLSWGADAQIQGNFHDAREGCRVCFCCRPCNMAWMGFMGAFNFCTCRAKDLDVSVEVRDDEGRWVQVPLPPSLKSIVLLNTPTYGGGRFLWGKDNPKKIQKPKKWECVSARQTVEDGLFEIVGISSTWHLGMVMGHFTRGIRLAQVNEARLTFRSSVYCQADGEPYIERPSTYHIRPLRPATMLTRPEKVVRT